ncbi:IS30 family transposase [Ensifer sp. YR511]|uniref:IS30 family transposase n=1 Tax=Ensifer sp. YR511 TaxID=1855294 RepID=UPI0008871F58|nr:IS30 family transposase [Ensifer sp. YR511]SDN71205.1 transposase, IS30 family [Ensifer sp. YR511]
MKEPRRQWAHFEDDACDPSAPWQKGAVENTNAFPPFMPGNTGLAAIPQHALNRLARDLNNQPRKCLCYKIPSEFFASHLQEAE